MINNKLYEKQKIDSITTILKLWSQFMILLSELCNTTAMTRLIEADILNESHEYCVLWPDLIKNLQAYQHKLSYCIENNLPSLIYEKSERLFSLSDGREQTISTFKNLIEDLKNTEKDSKRYINLRYAIVSLFNSLNMLLTEINRILTLENYQLKTNIYDLTPISKEDLGINF